MGGFSGNHLYELGEDPAETNNLAGGAKERAMAGLLHDALVEIEAPDDQMVRLGLG
jgi:hypothetical protein